MSATNESIRGWIAAALPLAERIEISGDGHHFYALIVAPEFEGKSRLARQRLILDPLRARIDSNEIHALSFTGPHGGTYTPAEFAARG